MFTRFATIVAVTLAVVSPAMADHLVTFKNNCGQRVTPMLTNTGGPFVQLASLGQGQTATTIIAEGVRLASLCGMWSKKLTHEFSGTLAACSGRLASAASRMAQDGKCPESMLHVSTHSRHLLQHSARVRLLEPELPPVQPVSRLGLQRRDELQLRHEQLQRQLVRELELRRQPGVLDAHERRGVAAAVQRRRRRHAVSDML
jgi:hypothetical protein